VKRLQAEVQASEQRFRTLTEATPQLVWTTAPDGQCDYLSRQWVEYTGVPEDKHLGYGWLSSLHPNDRTPTAQVWEQAVAGNIAYDVEFRIRRADGAYRWFKVRGVPQKDSAGGINRWVGTCTDIDDQKRQADHLEVLVQERTAALLEQQKALASSNSELEQFAYVASHDLQEPLRKIQAFGDRLAKKYRDDLGEQGKEYVDRMLSSAGRMRTLIDDLLSLSRVTTRGQPFTQVNLNDISREAISDLEIRLVQTGGRIEVGSLPTLTADAGQLRQLFVNLFGNALKFHRSGVPPIVNVAATRISDLPEGTAPPPAGNAAWRLTVTDNGIGFEQEYAERIFEVFQRLQGRGEYEGSGIGLAICRKIVERHGGAIVAQGRPGDGATFVIDLPA
jgi:PAS domain S-box-containing protein